MLKYSEFLKLNESKGKPFDSAILDTVMQNIQKCLAGYESKIPGCKTGVEFMPNTSSAQTAVIKVKTNMGRGDLQKYLKTALSEFNYNAEMKQSSSVKYGLFFKYPEENKPEKQLKNISITVKPQGRATEPDPNEAMVACLLLMGKKRMEGIIESGDYLDLLIEEAIKQKDKVKGGDKEIFNFFKGEYVNVVQAISAVRAIQEKFPNTPDDVFLTGGAFPSEISFLSVNNYMGMKQYNSSDIVIKYRDTYVGVSLKKATSPGNMPTLLNKSISNFFSGKETKVDGVPDVIETAINNFFNGLLKEKKINTSGNGWKKYINQLSTDEIREKIVGKESHYSKIHDMFVKMTDEDVNKLLSLIFKLDLKKLVNYDFEFYLVTGIGNINDSGKVVIQDGEITNLDTIIEFFSDVIQSNKITLVPSTYKKQVFEPSATAEKLFFQIKVEDLPLVNIEIRYKGSYTSMPQIFAFITPQLKSRIQMLGAGI